MQLFKKVNQILLALMLCGQAALAADVKISNMTALTSPEQADEFVIVDKSDTTQAASGSTKKITLRNLIGNPTNGSLMFADNGSLAQDNSNLFFDDTNNRLGIGTTTPVGQFQNKGVGNSFTSYGENTNFVSLTGSTSVSASNRIVYAPTTSLSSQAVGLLVEADLTGALSANQYAMYYSVVSPLANTTNYSSIAGMIGGVQQFGTGTVGSMYGTLNQILARGTGLITNMYGAYNNPILLVSGSQATNIIGTGSLPSIVAGSTVANVYGDKVSFNNAGTSTNSYGSRVDMSGAGTFTNTYGYYVGDITTGTQTNTPFSFYASDAGALNYFAGKTGINQTTPTSMLDVVASSSSTTGSIVKGAASQTVNLTEWQNSSGTVLASVNAAGGLYSNALSILNGGAYGANWGAGYHTNALTTLVYEFTTSSIDNVSARLVSDADNVIAQQNSTAAQTLRVYNTYTSATNYERGKLEWDTNVFNIGTEKGSGGGTARALAFHTDDTERMRIDATGNVGIGTATPSNTLEVNTALNFVGHNSAAISRTLFGGLNTVFTSNYNLITQTGTAPGASNAGAVISTSSAYTSGSTGSLWAEITAPSSVSSSQSHIYAIYGLSDHNSGASVTTVTGLQAAAVARGVGGVTTIRGLSFSGSVGNTYTGGTVTNLYGVLLNLLNNKADTTVTNFYGTQLANITNSGTITNTYGAYIGDITAGTQTNTPVSFYASDPNAIGLYSAGKIGINQTAPTSMLDVVASSSSTVGQIVKAAASQTANLTEWQGSSGTVLLNVTSAGDLNVTSGQFIRYNGQKLAYGQTALSNFFFGKAGNNTLTSMTGADNNGFGDGALFSLTSGSENNAMGINSLVAVTTGTHNVGIGRNAGAGISSGTYNVAIGYRTLNAASTASDNTAVGRQAGENNTSGTGNAFYGYFAGNLNTTGSQNLAAGTTALQNNTTGDHNMALGYQALSSIVGSRNVAVGSVAWGIATTGDNNTALGYQAGVNATSGSKNIIIGHNINIPTASGSNQLNIGNILFGTGVSGTGTTIAGSIGVGVTAPNSTLQVTGSLALSYVAKTTAYTITASDHTIDCTSGTFTVTLPAVSGTTGRIYVVKNSGAGIITLDGNASETIDGAATQTVVAGAAVTIQSTGTQWIII